MGGYGWTDFVADQLGDLWARSQLGGERGGNLGGRGVTDTDRHGPVGGCATERVDHLLDGAVVGTALANQSNLDDGETWKFKAHALTEFAKYRLDKITAF